MNLDVLAPVLMLALWAALGVVSWVGGAALRRGRGVLPALPLSAVGGLAGGLLVPALGRRDAIGLLVSLLAALLGGVIFAAAAFRLARQHVPPNKEGSELPPAR
jgi:hypothetical protein